MIIDKIVNRRKKRTTEREMEEWSGTRPKHCQKEEYFKNIFEHKNKECKLKFMIENKGKEHLDKKESQVTQKILLKISKTCGMKTKTLKIAHAVLYPSV